MPIDLKNRKKAGEEQKGEGSNVDLNKGKVRPESDDRSCREQRRRACRDEDRGSRQGISLKYLERILPVLTKNGLIEGIHGKGGGYRLCREPKEYKVGEILRLTEGNLAPVSCLECHAAVCERRQECRTIGMWTEFHKMINDYFDGITLEDLMKKERREEED